MLLAACEQFLGKSDEEIQHIALVTLEGHQRAIMGSMTVEVSFEYVITSHFRDKIVFMLSCQHLTDLS